MKIEEAINLIKQVASVYRGTIQEHQSIQTAIGVIENEIKNKKETKEKSNSKKETN